MSTAIPWPTKTRELHNHHFDSTIWNDFDFRDDDIIISTYAKSGTTWMQQIIAQMMFGGDPDLEVADMSPWLDLRVPPKEVKLPMVQAQTHRRFLKTHLPVDALVYSPQAKYLYIGRDGRDVVWSLFNHHMNTWAPASQKAPPSGTLFVAFCFIHSKEQYSRIASHRVSSMGISRKAAIRRICPGISRLRFAKCTNRIFGSARRAHQDRTFSQKGQKGWPSRSSQSCQYCRMSSGGGSIGGPMRPGVLLSASYHV